MLPMMKTNGWLPTVFNDILDTAFAPKAYQTAPAINVIETIDNYLVEIAAPGASKEDFNVEINADGDLKIKLEHKEEQKEENKNAHYLRREFSHSKFEQTLILPEDVKKENISAKVENGVLTVDLPKIKKEEAPKIGRQVEIK